MATEKTTTTKALTLSQKILELQKSVRGLAKDAENKGFRYTYVSGSKLLSVVRPKMDELGLTLTQTIVPDSIQITDKSIFLLLRFIWTDTASGETREDLWPSYGLNNSLDKAIGGAMTYSERYYLMKQLHIATDEDDVDGMEPVEQPKPAPKQPAPKTMETKPEPQQPKKVHITIDQVQNGTCDQIVEHMVKRADAKTGEIPNSEYEFIRDRYDWEPDAFGLAYKLACEAAKKNVQPQK